MNALLKSLHFEVHGKVQGIISETISRSVLQKIHKTNC